MPTALLATAMVALAVGQAVEPYVGTWIAEFDGAAFVRLELRVTGGSLGGRISLGHMEVDGDGRVKAAREATNRPTPIFDIVVRASGVSFSHKDSNDTDRFEMRLGPGDQAELRFMLDEATIKELAESGIAAPKPVAMKRNARRP